MEELLKNSNEPKDASRMQGPVDRGQATYISAKLRELSRAAGNGDINGVAVFWAARDGYNCVITNLAGDAFGLIGYINASTAAHMQRFVGPPEPKPPMPEDSEEDLGEDFA